MVETAAVLRKYELASVIGNRAKQISQGASILIKLTNEDDAVEIAKKEFAQGLLDAKITRIHADGTQEIW